MLVALLHGVSLTDPVTWLAAPAVFGTVALLAAYLAARRASREDPVIVRRPRACYSSLP